MSELDAFHFTSDLHLKKILRCGILVPTDYTPFGDELVWATSLPEGDDTAAPFHHIDSFEAGNFKLVRITFPKSLFMTWQEYKLGDGRIRRQLELGHYFDEWEEMTIDAYESDPETSWLVHIGDLPISKAVAIDQRTFDGPWKPIRQRFRDRPIRQNLRPPPRIYSKA
jgi:hypothetical protein